MALARDEVADGRDRRQLRARGRGSGGTSVPRCTTRVSRRAELSRALLGAGGVGEHEPGLGERARHRRAAARAADDREHVAAVDGDHDRHAGPRAPHRVAGRRGVVGVDEVEGEAAPQLPQRERQARRRPRAPAAVRARPRRRDERHVGHLDAVERGAERLAQRRDQRPRLARAQRRLRRHRAVQDEHAHVGPGVARGERLAVRPDAEHRVGGARVVLGDDRDAHLATRLLDGSGSPARRRCAPRRARPRGSRPRRGRSPARSPRCRGRR